MRRVDGLPRDVVWEHHGRALRTPHGGVPRQLSKESGLIDGLDDDYPEDDEEDDDGSNGGVTPDSGRDLADLLRQKSGAFEFGAKTSPELPPL